MEARVSELEQHKISYIGAIDAQRPGWKCVGQDTVIAGKRAVHEPGCADDGVIDVAGGDQPLLRRLIDKRMFEHGLLRDPQSRDRESVLVLAPIRVVSCRAQDDEPVHVLLAHPLKNVGYGPGKYVRLFPAAGAQRRENSAVAANGIHNRAEIEDISLNDTQVRVLRQPFGAAGKSRNGVSFSQRLGNNQLAGSSRSAEDDDLHLSPVILPTSGATTTLYMAQPFSKTDI
jgi:hypothetical protein